MRSLYINGTHAYRRKVDFARHEGVLPSKRDRFNFDAWNWYHWRRLKAVWMLEWSDSACRAHPFHTHAKAHQSFTRIAATLPPGGYCALYAVHVVLPGCVPIEHPADMLIVERPMQPSEIS